MSIRQISKILRIARNTVRQVVRKEDSVQERESKYRSHLPLVKTLFKECRGNVVRVQEELHTRHEIVIPYQTLTWLIRKHEIRKPRKKRAGEYTFDPGEEQQHDTSPHTIIIGGKKVVAQCASMVLAYSRKIFIQYYPRFTRFECKVFLTKAFEFMDGACSKSIIDNTNVVVACGCGPDAVINPEMEYFGSLFGTSFEAHRLNDPNRKARVERPFYFVETNFIPGRTFDDWQDLNRQVVMWCREKANSKYKRSLGMSPDEAYIMEKHLLKPLPLFTPPVYQSYNRVVDIQGYVQLETNRYSVPHTLVGQKVEVQKHCDNVLIYDRQKLVADHKRLVDKSDTRTTISGHHPPLNRKRSHQGQPKEERLLKDDNHDLDCYVENLKKRSRGRGVLNLRRLLTLQRTYPKGPFNMAVSKALRYGLYDLARLEKIILDTIAGDFFDL